MSILRAPAFLLAGIFLVLGCSDAGTSAGGASAGAGGTINAAGAGTMVGPLTAGGSSGSSAAGAASAGSNSGGTSGAAGVGTAGASNGGAGSHLTGRSAGCGKPVGEFPKEWAKHGIQVTVAPAYTASFGMRTYFTRPPKDYEMNTAYPLVVWGQGCGQNADPEETQFSGSAAAGGVIQIELLADSDNHACYSAGPDGDHVDSPEVPYFDAVLAEVENAYCVDKSKVYMAGWSSGGWLTSLLACTRTDVIKAVGWASAGLQLNHPECVGPMPAILERGVDDGGTPLAQTEQARESLRLRNGCSTETEPWDPGEKDFDTSTCVSYKGCKPGYPVVWCPIPGGHNNGGKLASIGYWKFWSALP